VGQLDPNGVSIASFGKPTREERAHDFLWRIRAHLPRPGKVGVFDRSHYEDVVTVRVHELVARATWRRRFATINRFEEKLAAGGTTVVKCFLHISRDEQRERLLARLDDPTKHWKYNSADLETRARWDDYMTAYGEAIQRCATPSWHIVPADRKWYRNWAITTLLIEQLEALQLSWPEADFDVEGERAKLLATS
jgi:PPK2 family polyphosphate:nucleotide phosphotransferase